jgi:hypothetical protein
MKLNEGLWKQKKRYLWNWVVTWYVEAKYGSLDCFKLEHNILLLPEKVGSNICTDLVPILIVA